MLLSWKLNRAYTSYFNGIAGARGYRSGKGHALAHQWRGFDPVLLQLSARGLLVASPQRGDFMYLMARYSFAFKSRYREYVYQTLREQLRL